MARVRHSGKIGSRDARGRLPKRPEPYWQVIERGLSLGYRKSAEGGAWLLRRYDPASGKHREQRIATADDHREPDGSEVLDFAQAQRRVLAEAHTQALTATGKLYTVKDAVTDYLAHLREDRKDSSAFHAGVKLNAYVAPKLGERKLAALAPADFTEWRTWALKRKMRRKAKTLPVPKKRAFKVARPKKPEPQTKAVDANEQHRKRKVTINRVIATLKAALNYAHKSGKVADADAWKQLKKFRSVDSARQRWLSVDEAIRLQNAAAAEFRPLVRAALLTGCRMGELLAFKVRDFDARTKTLLVAESKSGKPRNVPLRDDAVELFKALTDDKGAGDSVFVRANGALWYRIAVLRAMSAANEAAKIQPPATFHSLRHTYASHLVQAKVPLLNVAAALGHSDTRMVEKHYGHLAPSHHAELIHAALPSFATGNVVPIDSKRKTRRK